MNYLKNNLKRALSPYLQQHRDNPIWWQEWSPEVLDYAKRKGKILFVSVGYATCHWCHVMASEAFSDGQIADYLNQHFVAIKVDREQRPDIDRFLLNFIAAIGGQGGWPLNGFLTPDLKPIFALTYAGVGSRFGQPGFLEILKRVKKFYEEDSKGLSYFSSPQIETGECDEEKIFEIMWGAFDQSHGGFGNAMKFPPHSTLLFLLYHFAASGDQKIKVMLTSTLDEMLWGGLHDHLAGGFYRYCVDRQWRIPHFEKMLYDQAMLLWIYSLAYQIFREDAYRIAAERIVTSLHDTFLDGHWFYSAHDADTDHEEGATYLWSAEELKSALTKEEYQQFVEVYAITTQGILGGKNHLIKKKKVFLEEIEKKLLKQRQQRPQPFTDKKIVTAWNALTGIGLIHAFRALGKRDILDQAVGLFDTLMKKHVRFGQVAHSSWAGALQREEFLQDVAALTLFSTYIYEETQQFEKEMLELSERLKTFRSKGIWIESLNADFMPILADPLDLPTPSSISLAELALLRAKILQGKNYGQRKFQGPLSSDFLNIASLLANGWFHIVTTPQTLGWEKMPINSLQVRGKKFCDCYRGVCQENLAGVSG